MIKKELKERIDQQIKMEFDSANIYLAMSIYFADKGWEGFSRWMFKQSEEEREHAEKMILYVLSRGEKPTLLQQDKTSQDFSGVLECFEETYKHECLVSKSIDEIVTMAIKAKDYATEGFFRGFVTEQVEEEETAAGIVDRLKLAGDNAGFLILDAELGARQD